MSETKPAMRDASMPGNHGAFATNAKTLYDSRRFVIESRAMIEIALILIVAALCVIAYRVNQILKLLEAEKRSRAESQRIRQLEPLKP